MINSISFQQTLMREPFTYGKSNQKITLYEYFTEIHRPSFLASLKKNTIGLPETAAAAASDEAAVSKKAVPEQSTPSDSLSNKGSATPDSASMQDRVTTRFEITDLNSKEKSVINQMQSRISAGFQRRTGIVSVQAKMPEAELAAKVIKLTLKVLQEQVISYKTARGKTYRTFLLSQQSEAKTDLDRSRESLISFEGQSSQPLNQRLELQSRYRYALDRYGTLTEQVQRVDLTIEKQMQAFRVLDDITVPGQKSEPNRKVILFFSLLLGFLVALCWITVAFFASALKSNASS
jgi:hypothetical protein